ncbi:BamA/TamA family outer membrane protein [Sediminicola luteus]|uniref:Bacterial surface antigen (D15) domain-containing protein n=1 Tax=Sediminicola luteus TaxID=319238 RepID=A0A2A4G8I8_9FLAO|nr:BamA/TamA family outer membrane protein [Sediminicola luteus]PCE64298.1 hypothetical protein B7P33_08330 [Sediminicola luteus]
MFFRPTSRLLFVFILIFSTFFGMAQQKDSKKKEKKIEIAPIPYINYDRTLGASLGAVPMAMYRLKATDTISPKSLTGIMGVYTTNGSWFGMAFQKMFFAEDRYRFVGVAGLGVYNFQMFLDFPPVGYIDYRTTMDFVMLKFQRRVSDKLFLGVHYQNLHFTSDIGEDEIVFSDDDLQGIGLSLAMDTKDDEYYPKHGWLNEVKWISFADFLGNEDASNKVEIELNHYRAYRNDKDVLALRFYGGLGIGGLTFNQQFVVGNRSDIRGYTQGTYRGDYMLAGQGEYRYKLSEKWGLVGFGGVATIFESINDSHNGKLLPAVGTGFRYAAFPKNNFNVGIDAAVGDGDWGVYFRIGESF